MSLSETVSFDKEGHIAPTGLRATFRKVFLALVILLMSLLGFAVGRLTAGGGQSGIKIEYDQSMLKAPRAEGGENTAQNTSTAGVFASSKGKKYYYPGCKSTISEANKITFASSAMAEQAGYTLATGCLAK